GLCWPELDCGGTLSTGRTRWIRTANRSLFAGHSTRSPQPGPVPHLSLVGPWSGGAGSRRPHLPAKPPSLLLRFLSLSFLSTQVVGRLSVDAPVRVADRRERRSRMFLSTRSVGGGGFAAGLAALLLAATTALAEIENTVSGNVRQQVVPAPQPVLRLVPVPVPYQVTVHVETPPSEQVT